MAGHQSWDARWNLKCRIFCPMTLVGLLLKAEKYGAWRMTFVKVRGEFPVRTLDKEREVWRYFPSYYQIIPVGCGKGHPPSKPIPVNKVVICRSAEMHFLIKTIPVSSLKPIYHIERKSQTK